MLDFEYGTCNKDKAEKAVFNTMERCKVSPWQYLRFYLNRARSVKNPEIQKLLTNYKDLSFNPIVIKSRSNGKTKSIINKVTNQHVFPFFDEHLFLLEYNDIVIKFTKTESSILGLTVREKGWLQP